MLHREKVLGRHWIGIRVAARLRIMFSRRKAADLDLVGLNPHLRRDLGLDGNRGYVAPEIWRK